MLSEITMSLIPVGIPDKSKSTKTPLPWPGIVAPDKEKPSIVVALVEIINPLAVASPPDAPLTVVPSIFNWNPPILLLLLKPMLQLPLQLFCSQIQLVHIESLVSASSIEKDIKSGQKVNKTELSKIVAEKLAKKAQEKKITKIYFDRGIYKYHGRVKVFAETLRKNGMEF